MSTVLNINNIMQFVILRFVTKIVFLQNNIIFYNSLIIGKLLREYVVHSHCYRNN